MRLAEWSALHHFRVALLRKHCELPLYEGMADSLKALDAALAAARTDKSAIEIAPQAMNLAALLGKIPTFRGVAFLQLKVEVERVEKWLTGMDRQAIVSDPGFLSASSGAGYALDRFQPTALFRFLGDSAGTISPLSVSPEDREVVFPPGERFNVVRIHKRYLGRQWGRVWMIDLEQTEWRSQPAPQWPEYDNPHHPREIPEDGD